MPKQTYTSQEEKDKVKHLIKDIKGVHFKLGEGLPDFKSTNTAVFAYDQEKANKSKTKLDQELIKDLRSTHYKLGYQDNKMSTSTHSAYIPFNVRPNTAVDNNLKASSIRLNPSNGGINEKTTIYMQDYTKKEVVD